MTQFIEKVAAKDNFYSDGDKLQFKFAVEQWINLFKDMYPEGVEALELTLCEHGLTDTIRYYDEVSSLIINHADSDSFPIVQEIGLKKTLFLYRFLKRYTWNDMSAMDDEMLRQFQARNNRTKLIDRRYMSTWLWQELQAIATSYVRKCDGPVPVDIYTDIPTGAVAESYNCMAEKLYVISNSIPFGGLPLPCGKGEWIGFQDDPSKRYWSRSSRLMFVPKNYKTERAVCPEPLISQYYMTGYQKGLERLLHSRKGIFHPGGRVTLEDQGRSRELAVQGSRDGSISTIDLTAASDGISHNTFYATTPPIFWSVSSLLSRYTKYDDMLIPLYMVATMGSRLTMPGQTLVYWNIVCLACRLVAETDEELTRLLDSSSIIGDDIVIPTVAAETCMDLLRRLGLIVNNEKSFIDPTYLYREACGVEAYQGEIISSAYWPRDVFQTPDQAVSLYNRVYSEFGYLENFHSAFHGLPWKIYPVDDENAFGYLTDRIPMTPAVKGKIPFATIQSGKCTPILPDIHMGAYPVRVPHTKYLIDGTRDIVAPYSTLRELTEIFQYYKILRDGAYKDQDGYIVPRDPRHMLAHDTRSTLRTEWHWQPWL